MPGRVRSLWVNKVLAGPPHSQVWLSPTEFPLQRVGSGLRGKVRRGQALARSADSRSWPARAGAWLGALPPLPRCHPSQESPGWGWLPSAPSWSVSLQDRNKNDDGGRNQSRALVVYQALFKNFTCINSLILPTTLWGRCYHFPHFTDEETE